MTEWERDLLTKLSCRLDEHFSQERGTTVIATIKEEIKQAVSEVKYTCNGQWHRGLNSAEVLSKRGIE